MSSYSSVQFLSWNLYTGPIYNNSLQAVDYSGIRTTEQDRRWDLLSQCLDISSRVYFTGKAMELARCQADPDRSVLKIFIAPEFTYRGAAGAYLHDLLQGWIGPAPFEDLPSPYDQNWEGLLGGLQALAAKQEYEDWVFVFGTAVSAAFQTQQGRIQYSLPVTGYNTALIQRGGAGQDRRSQNHITRKCLKSDIDYLQLSQSSSTVFLHNAVWQEGSDPGSAAETAALVACRLVELDGQPSEGSARFQLPEVCGPDGKALQFGVEICLDHALTCPLEIQNESCVHCTKSGRLNMTGLAVDLQLVPSCGMSLRPSALCLTASRAEQTRSYAFNCDGLSILGNLLGCHSQLWTQLNADQGQRTVPLDERSQLLNTQNDEIAVLPSGLADLPEDLTLQATAWHLWNSRPLSATAGADLVNWPKGAGSITASAVYPL